MRYRQWIWKSIIGLLFISMMVGTGIAQERTRTFGVALGWTVNDFGVACKETIQQELKTLFPGCKILIADANYDPARQISQIETFIRRKVDAIFITPADPTALVDVIKKADAAGIPVFCGDSYPVGAPVKTVAMSNNFSMGYANGIYIAEQLKGHGKIALISLPENSSWYERTLGLYYALKRYPGIEVVADYEYVPGGVGALTPKEAARTILQAHPEIDAFWCSWDGASIEVTELAMALGKEEMIVVGIDGFEQALDYIRQGTPLRRTCAQSPREMMRTIAWFASEYFKGHPIPRIVITPVYFFTHERVPPSGLGPYGYDTLEFILSHPNLMKRDL